MLCVFRMYTYMLVCYVLYVYYVCNCIVLYGLYNEHISICIVFFPNSYFIVQSMLNCVYCVLHYFYVYYFTYFYAPYLHTKSRIV